MNTYRCIGRDIYVNQPREWWAEAGSPEEARALVVFKGLHDDVEVVAADAKNRPDSAPLYRVPVPVESATPGRRRARYILIGMGLGLFLVAGFLFSIKASEHLGRGRPPMKQQP